MTSLLTCFPEFRAWAACNALTAKSGTHTGSYSGLYKPDPRGKHMFDDGMRACRDQAESFDCALQQWEEICMPNNATSAGHILHCYIHCYVHCHIHCHIHYYSTLLHTAQHLEGAT